MTGGPERIHRQQYPDGNFVQLPNESVRDPRLSLRARAIYAHIMSRPNNWIFSAARIAAEVPDGIYVVRKAFRELETYGYLHRKIVHGPHGRLATELHLYDIPPGDTGYRFTGSRSTELPVTELPVTEAPVTEAPVTEAPVTEAPVTGKPVTEAPVTGKPVTGQSVNSRSLQRPSTKTRTNTVKENRSFSLGEMLRPRLPDMAEVERERFAEFMVSGCSNRQKRPAYLRKIIANGDLPAQLAEFRGDAAPDGQKPPAAGTRQGPPCPHGAAGGAEIMPSSGKPWCPLCRTEAPAGQA